MGNADRALEAMKAAHKIQCQFSITRGKGRVGLVLGTGWSGALNIENRKEMSFRDIPGFESLGNLEGHARNLVYGTMGNKKILALNGRVHLNEGHGEDIAKMVRLQTEMLFAMGVDKLIITSAVGSLDEEFPVGSVAIVKDFITLLAPDMPMWGGEFYSPEDMLNDEFNREAEIACDEAGLISGYATHVMVRGPFFEGRKKDKGLLRLCGANVVGMSMLPEACVASVYNIPVVGLGFVTNNDTEEHSHEENMLRAKQSQAKLGAMLTSLVENI